MTPNPLMQRLQMKHPIVQAPLAGGADTPALVAAVCEAGGIGFIGASYIAPAQIEVAAKEIRARTKRPFGINLFAPQPAPAMPQRTERAVAKIAAYHAELGLPPPTQPAPPADGFAAQFAACLDSGAAAFSFTFGIFSAEAIAAIEARGMLAIGSATTVAEARALAAAGVDAVVAQGSEAGGHRGTFLGAFEAGMVGTLALVPQIADAVKIPVIASGGIMDGRGIVAALALGASAVQMGTAFLACPEAGTPAVYKQAILAARDDGTRITRAFSGRPARGIPNTFMAMVAGKEHTILPFRQQNDLTRPMRNAAGQQGIPGFISLWAGQGVARSRAMPAADLVQTLIEESSAAEVARS
jgi:nitronate monooxygenase